MLMNFDKVFNDPNKKALPKKYPCDECEEKKFLVNNPYYISSKCGECVKSNSSNKSRKQEINFNVENTYKA